MVYPALATSGGAAQAAFCSEDCEMAAFGGRTAPSSGGSADGLEEEEVRLLDEEKEMMRGKE